MGSRCWQKEWRGRGQVANVRAAGWPAHGQYTGAWLLCKLAYILCWYAPKCLELGFIVAAKELTDLPLADCSYLVTPNGSINFQHTINGYD